MKVSVFGIGLMGKPIALRLAEKGCTVSVYNRTRKKAIKLRGNEIHPSTTVKDAVRRSDILIAVLSDFSAVEETFVHDQTLSFQGKTFIQMGTISSEQSKSLLKFFRGKKCRYLEAPVLGSIPQVRDGSLIILLGGSKAEYRRCRQLFSQLGTNIYFLGAVGNAMAFKLALNQLIISLTVAFSTSLGFIEKKFSNTETFMEILRQSALYASTFDKKIQRMLHRDFSHPNFPVKHLLKDLNLIVKEFSQSGIMTGTLEETGKLLSEAINQGYAEEDYSALYNIINPMEPNASPVQDPVIPAGTRKKTHSPGGSHK